MWRLPTARQVNQLPPLLDGLPQKMPQLLQLRSIGGNATNGYQPADQSGALLGKGPHRIRPPADEVPLVNRLINRLHEPGASGHKRSLVHDVQESIARTHTLVRWGRKIEDGGNAVYGFFVF